MSVKCVLADQLPESGVTSFNGRKGNVTPQNGDYTAAQVGARPSTWTPTASEVGALPSGGTAAAATKLATARTIQTNLASTSASSFDGTGNVTPGITGTLSTAHGGTNASNAASGLYNLISGSDVLTSSTLASGDYLALDDVSAGTGKKITVANLANWINLNGSGVKIEYGSYKGTGTYGSSNPNQVSFSTKPTFFWIYLISTDINGTSYQSFSPNYLSASASTCVKTGIHSPTWRVNSAPFLSKISTSYAYYDNMNTFKWYNTTSAEEQLNHNGYYYFWIMIANK